MTLTEPITAVETVEPPVDQAPPRRRRRRFPFGPASTVAVLGVFVFGPVYWVLVTALTPTHDVFQFPPRLWPAHLTFSHFTNLVHTPELLHYLVNSLVVSLATAVLFDDVNYDSIHKLMRYLLNYPAYKMIGVAGTPKQPPSVLGRLRRSLSNTTMAKTFLREALLSRPWDRGWGSSVALQKTAPDERPFDWYVDF